MVFFLRDHHPTQGGPGGQDRAVEPQHRRDHLPEDQGQVEPPDQTLHPGCAQDHEADRQYQRDVQALCGEQEEGAIFINEMTGKRLTLRHFEKMIDKWARMLNIQRHQSIKPSGREYHLITLIRLRERQERGNIICSGGDPDVSAKAAGHSKERKERYYKKVSFEETQESFGRYHPAFVEGGEINLYRTISI